MFRVLRNTKKQILSVKNNNIRFYSKIDKTVLYSKDHEWIRVEGDGYENIGTVGKNQQTKEKMNFKNIRCFRSRSRSTWRYYLRWNQQRNWRRC